MKHPVLLLLITMILTGQAVSGQYYDTGQDPASLKWMQIKTGRFRIIYPEKYGSGGKAFAQSLDEANSKLTTLFPEKKFRIPVIIHNYTTQSNGYVAWAPRRMEIYPTPEQNTIPLDPDKQLALHELAHVLQMESLNRGFSKVMTILTGEQFTGFISSLLPLWFLEGDAVFAETYLSASGRGRTPSFQKQLKALAVERGSLYKFDKILFGSYRDYVPDHYQYGYQMVTWAMAKHDPQIWNKVLKFTAEEPFTINPVNISLSRDAGLTKKKLFKETFDTLKTIWTNDVSHNNSIAYQTVNPEKEGNYINYYSPVLAGSDSILAIKTSLSDPPVFVLIKLSEKTEKRIHTPGQIYPWYFSYARGRLVWVENQPDPRWENRNYSVIKLMDLRDKITIRLSRKSRYMSVSISPDGRKIAAVENTVSNINNLVFIDPETGTELQSVPVPGNAYLQRPQWSDEGDKITVIYLTDAGEGIMSYSTENHNWETLVEAGRNDLQSTFLRNDSLFFISSLSGTDNIYLLTPDQKIIGLSKSKFGATDLSLKGDNMVFSDYSETGNNICITPIQKVPATGTTTESSTSFLINRFKTIPQSIDKRSGDEYLPEPYRKWLHPFRFHSWMPFYADIEEIQSNPASIRPGVTILSQNDLSTVISSIGYEYSNDKTHVFHSRVTWKGWYPEVESKLDYGANPQIYKSGEQVGNPSDIRPGVSFSNAVSVPLQFSSGKFTQFLRPSITSDFRNSYIYIKQSGTYDYGQTILSGRLYFSNYHISSIRDIYPRWAQTIDINYAFAPFDKVIYGTSLSVRTSFYMPGILSNNGLRLRFEIEDQHPALYQYGNTVSFPRGYYNIISRQIGFLSGDYVFPVAYPDFNISSLLYLKRIRSGLFYDYASGRDNTYYNQNVAGMPSNYFHNYKETFRSFGIELMADFHILRIPFMISGGTRAVWKNINREPVFEALFNIDLFGLTLGKRQL